VSEILKNSFCYGSGPCNISSLSLSPLILAPCSLSLSASSTFLSEQTSQRYFSLRTNQHQPNEQAVGVSWLFHCSTICCIELELVVKKYWNWLGPVLILFPRSHSAPLRFEQARGFGAFLEAAVTANAGRTRETNSFIKNMMKKERERANSCIRKSTGPHFLFLFQFVNLYDSFEIYQNYTTAAVRHGGCRLTAVEYGSCGASTADSRNRRRLHLTHGTAVGCRGPTAKPRGQPTVGGRPTAVYSFDKFQNSRINLRIGAKSRPYKHFFPRVALPRGVTRAPPPATLNPHHQSSRGPSPPSPLAAAASVLSLSSSPPSFPSSFPPSERHHHEVAPRSAAAVSARRPLPPRPASVRFWCPRAPHPTPVRSAPLLPGRSPSQP
jgi:hypothetical protein